MRRARADRLAVARACRRVTALRAAAPAAAEPARAGPRREGLRTLAAVDPGCPEGGPALRSRLQPGARVGGVATAVQQVELDLRERCVDERDPPVQDDGAPALRLTERDA